MNRQEVDESILGFLKANKSVFPGFSFRELSQELGIPLGTLHRAVLDLQSQGRLSRRDRIARSIRITTGGKK